MYRLGLGVLHDFNKLRLDTQAKNIAAWTPVVAEILQGFVRFDDKAVCIPARCIFFLVLTDFKQFTRYLPAIYPLATDLLMRETGPELREALRDIFVRVGRAKRITDRT